MAQQKRRPNTMVYGNLAYDLDTLASQRQLEEAARPERQSQPQQAPRHRTAARPRQRVSPLALCAVGALAAMAVVLVMGYIQLTAVTGSISDLQEQVSQLEDQRVSLVMDYERTFDMAKIKEAAEAAGMKKPTAGQVEYVELGGGRTGGVNVVLGLHVRTGHFLKLGTRILELLDHATTLMLGARDLAAHVGQARHHVVALFLE